MLSSLLRRYVEGTGCRVEAVAANSPLPKGTPRYWNWARSDNESIQFRLWRPSLSGQAGIRFFSSLEEMSDYLEDEVLLLNRINCRLDALFHYAEREHDNTLLFRYMMNERIEDDEHRAKRAMDYQARADRLICLRVNRIDPSRVERAIAVFDELMEGNWDWSEWVTHRWERNKAQRSAAALEEMVINTSAHPANGGAPPPIRAVRIRL